MPEMHLMESHTVLVGYLRKAKKENQNLKKQKIHDIFIKTNQIKLVFNMTWLM